MVLMQAFQVSEEALQMIEAHKKRLGVTSASDVLRALIRESRVPDTASMLSQVIVDTANELGCAPDNEEILLRIHALQENLRQIRRRTIFGPALTTGALLDLTQIVAPVEKPND